MNKEQALEVKSILMDCKGSIPATHVDRVFHYYRSYINANMVKPCTCSPKYWSQMLIELRDKVENTLASYEQQESQEEKQEIRLGENNGNNGQD